MNNHKISHFLSFLVMLIQIPIGGLCITSCNDVSEEEYQYIKKEIHYESDSLRVLILGNSFSYDGTAYLEEISEALHLDGNRFCVYNGFIGSGGFQEWTDVFLSNDTILLTRMAGGIDMKHSSPLRELLQQPWELCVILQGSHQSYKWNSFEHCADHLISLIKSQCPNQKIKIAYAMPWSHTVVNTPTELSGNIKCARKIVEEYEVDFVIPVGTAIQNAREAKLDNGKYLTRDDWHICHGAGRYISACTWYESVLEPFFHVSMLDCGVLHPLTASEREDPTSLPVTETIRRLCQQCAYQAVQNPFKVTKLAGE